MLRLVHVHAGKKADLTLRPGIGTIEAVPLAGLGDVERTSETILVVDIDLRDAAVVRRFRAGLGEARQQRMLFLIDRGNRVQEIQAMAIGAGALVTRPVDHASFEGALRSLLPAEFARAEMELRRSEIRDEALPEAIAAGTAAMSAVFEGFSAGSPPSGATVRAWSESLDEEVDAVGLDRWLATVRNHHGGTYQHCLVVSGIASRFGADMGLPPVERQILTAAALMHDVGKVRISPALLDKPGPLTDAEFAIFRRHPAAGAEYLAGTDVDPRIVSAVRHHHEYLDGSGYPDGIAGAEIHSLTRMITIADIFGALIEQRSYKLPLPGPVAYRELRRLADAGKLDGALVRAFRATAEEITTTQVSAAGRWAGEWHPPR